MKRFSSYLLLLSLFAVCFSLPSAQTRPRRVHQNGQPTTTTAPPRSQYPATTPSRTPSTPTSPPVLRGNTRAPGSPSTNPEPVVADNGPEEVDAGDVIKVDTTLVTIPVSVTDRNGRYIPNLRKDDFRLWEDGVEQQVAFFNAVDKPFSVVLMIDTSGSTRFRLEDIQDAAITFVNQLRRDDKVMVVSFDNDVQVLSDFTTDRNRLRDAILRTRTGNSTRLYDAVDLVINDRLSRVDGRKAVVLFTDGVDTTSRHASYESNLRDAEELDALIYPVQYDTYADMGGGGGGGGNWPVTQVPSPVDILIQILGGGSSGGNKRRGGGGGGGGGGTGTSRNEYELANRYLQDLSEVTGARKYQADSIQNIAVAFSNIAEELRRQYSLGYYPKNPAQAGQRRQIRVRVNQPNLAVRTRDTYIFNPGTKPPDTARSAPVLRRQFSEEQYDRWIRR
ncbi:MAG TPA: VWA domain-containing protein [Pyrinomonadaceae bacterium]|nr:VWA domain-containing protein [Pyrinomonadaceae bacterium]